MGMVMVYTIEDNYVVDQFECEREIAMVDYWNQHPSKGGRYLIANPSDKIKYKWRRKELKDIRHSSVSSTFHPRDSHQQESPV